MHHTLSETVTHLAERENLFPTVFPIKNTSSTYFYHVWVREISILLRNQVPDFSLHLNTVLAITVIWSLPLYPTKTKAKIPSCCLCNSSVTTSQNDGVLLLLHSKFSSHSKKTASFSTSGFFLQNDFFITIKELMSSVLVILVFPLNFPPRCSNCITTKGLFLLSLTRVGWAGRSLRTNRCGTRDREGNAWSAPHAPHLWAGQRVRELHSLAAVKLRPRGARLAGSRYDGLGGRTPAAGGHLRQRWPAAGGDLR